MIPTKKSNSLSTMDVGSNFNFIPINMTLEDIKIDDSQYIPYLDITSLTYDEKYKETLISSDDFTLSALYLDKPNIEFKLTEGMKDVNTLQDTNKFYLIDPIEYPWFLSSGIHILRLNYMGQHMCDSLLTLEYSEHEYIRSIYFKVLWDYNKINNGLDDIIVNIENKLRIEIDYILRDLKIYITIYDAGARVMGSSIWCFENGVLEFPISIVPLPSAEYYFFEIEMPIVNIKNISIQNTKNYTSKFSYATDFYLNSGFNVDSCEVNDINKLAPTSKYIGNAGGGEFITEYIEVDTKFNIDKATNEYGLAISDLIANL